MIAFAWWLLAATVVLAWLGQVEYRDSRRASFLLTWGAVLTASSAAWVGMVALVLATR